MPSGNGSKGEAEAFLRGDPCVVADVCETVHLAVLGFQFPDHALNKDLAQEALARVFFGLNSGRFRGESSLKTYAGRVARYTCLEHLRRRRREVELDAETLPSRERWSQPEEAFFCAEEHLRNLETFASLPSDCRELLRMIFVDGFTYREIGLKLGLSAGAVKTRVHRCRAACRRGAAERRPLGIAFPKRRAGQCE